MSATISCQEFAHYFAVPIRNRLYPVYVFEVEGKPHTIEEYYLDELKSIISHIRVWKTSQHFFFEEPVIHPEMYKTAVALIRWFDKLELKESVVICSIPEFIIFFLRLQVYPLHSTVSLEDQNNVFMSPVPGYRKILLSTNIAESSVTVPDVKYVIDFCLTRTLVCDEDTNYQSLRLCWASKNSCNQRRGRAGRISKGYCYRLVCKDFWANCIPESSVPEMTRCPLENTVLKVKMLDMGEPVALLATALSPPSISDIERTILHLKEIGALSIGVHSEGKTPYDGELTFLGKVLAQLPVDQRLGKLIVFGHVFGCLEECLIIAAALSLNNFFVIPFRQHLDGYRNKLHFSGNSRSDCIAIVNAFKVTIFSPLPDELDWGRSNYIHIKRIREVAELYEELKRRVGAFNMHISTRPPAMDCEHEHKQRFILQVVMAGAFYPNYFTFGHHDEDLAVRELTGKDPKTTVVLKNIPPYGFLYHKQLQSLFRQCGQVKSISYDGAKAFVEFSRNPTERFKTLPPVYMALKMSQLRIPLELNVHFPEEIEGKMEGVAAAIVRGTRYGIQDMSQHITNILFYERNMTLLKNISAEINHLQLSPLPVRPYPDLVCLAPFNDWENERYYRAQVLYVSGESAEVFYVDYGNRLKVALEHLREIPSHLRELPFQALEFKVRRLRPSAHSLVCGERWSRAASQRFASLVHGCALMVKVFSVVHGVLHVDVFRYFENLDLVNIRSILFQECHAELVEDSFESKVCVLFSYFWQQQAWGTTHCNLISYTPF
uniref:RNA helicase n=1 Tax=Varanus komodoensis TaxID=61221 RepID=A0A8D2J6V3_VARKO